METLPPEGSKDFEELMTSVDRDLARDGFSIPERPINALGVLSRKFSIPLPITPPISNANHEVFKNWPISECVYKWYELRYGDRTKIDYTPGRMVVLIEEDLWVLKLPRIFGSVELTISRTMESERMRSDRRPPIYNVLDSIQDFPSARKKTVPEKELKHIFEKFLLGLDAFSILEGSNHTHLIGSAIADISSSVDHLLDRSEQFGLSKWSSLQAAEKIMKAAIKLNNGKYSTTHDLTLLTNEAKSAGISGNWMNLIQYIQCSPGIRYGDEPCSRNEALLAHNAVFELIIVLSKSGAKFTSNMEIQGK